MKRQKTKPKSKIKKEVLIVKRKGHTEPYDERKVYASCYFACRNAHIDEPKSEKICMNVCTSVTKAINKKRVVTSDEIFKCLANELRKHDEDAAFLYETHRDIS